MGFIQYNPNPQGKSTGDCAIRAVAKAIDTSWQTAYSGLIVEGYKRGDLPNANHVWGAYLRRKGFKKGIVPDTCPDCYTVAEFAADHPHGTYVLALPGHVVCVQNGDYYDSWDSGQEVPLYFWWRKDDKEDKTDGVPL